MGVVSGIYSGVKYEVLTPSTMDDVIDTLVTQNQKDRICNIMMVPRLMWEWFESDESEEMGYFDATINIQDMVIGAYTPRNKKLLCYPYKFTAVDTTTEAKDYKIELFHDRVVKFRCYFLVSPNPEVIVCPMDYNGSGDSTAFKNGTNFTENVKMSGYPQCAMSIDSYAAWLSQNYYTMMLSAAGAGVATVGGIMSGNVPALLGGVGAMGKMVADAARESAKGSTSRGTACSSAIAAAGGLVIYVKIMGVKEETARMLDDYFDKYGYICNKIKVPGITNRPHWSYVKTKNCTIKGGVPVNYAKRICEIFDAGITWWRNPADFGDYSKNNTPIYSVGSATVGNSAVH